MYVPIVHPCVQARECVHPQYPVMLSFLKFLLCLVELIQSRFRDAGILLCVTAGRFELPEETWGGMGRGEYPGHQVVGCRGFGGELCSQEPID